MQNGKKGKKRNPISGNKKSVAGIGERSSTTSQRPKSQNGQPVDSPLTGSEPPKAWKEKTNEEKNAWGLSEARDFTYTNAKTVMLGESGVGKTTLGHPLVHGSYKELPSSHGQNYWVLDFLSHSRCDGAECQAVLWDLAGQADYRLIHPFFLNQVDVALILFNPADRDQPLRGVDYWLSILQGTQFPVKTKPNSCFIYGNGVQEWTRLMFQSLFEHFLSRREVVIERYPPVDCPNSDCGYRQERESVLARLKKGSKHIYCAECGTISNLPNVQKKIELKGHIRERVEDSDRKVRRRKAYEEVITGLKSILAEKLEKESLPQALPVCFVSYAWESRNYYHRIERLDQDLRNAGMKTILDRRDSLPASRIEEHIAKIPDADFVLICATPTYLQRATRGRGKNHVLVREYRKIMSRLGNHEQSGTKPVVPLLVRGAKESALPAPLVDMNYLDFSSQEKYFHALLELPLFLFGIPKTLPAVADLIKRLDKETKGPLGDSGPW